MIVTNGWYLAAWSDEIDESALTQRWIAGQPVLLYRTADGTARALDDRCPHRRFPLSMGRRDGDVLECGYHGYRFDGSTGVCIGVAEQADQPKAQAHKYPLVEKYGALWIWTGDATPDPSLIPDMSWIVDDSWAVMKGVLPLKARHRLLVENLLDLSHETFLHPSSIGNAAVAATPIEVTAAAHRDVVAFSRRMTGIEAPPFYVKSCGLTGLVDRWQDGEFHAPGIFLIDIRIAPTGTEEPEGFHMKVLYGMTPETDGSCHDFYALGRDFLQDDEELTDFQHRQQLAVMAEDVVALEVQELMLADDRYAPKESSIRSDLAALRGRRLLDRMYARETSSESSAAPV
ncbi:aromatic ring-hydroxylating dioxygenase subunit alpha [Prescottella agglutinans]|uniref:Phenylpropionate dioxygenase-like ring-hydroxylating dioxygenase large terminal subunit n=1 Tax=Prescottella agglutinans TaxID=1644129 RepID=A0ABT6M8Z6_9NOCA|nr:aromatic ring-hydroxylating dioxygenase subunit alpha [Prescottella agglutinans]MDH6280782.1 phenylpropionate dioxygenase-like ring-hydroxylating dioxygenase large terminal subunit [Prescottella agglutinans]